jgi:hypothetical protein
MQEMSGIKAFGTHFDLVFEAIQDLFFHVRLAEIVTDEAFRKAPFARRPQRLLKCFHYI